MKKYLKILLGIIALLYIISPYDILPDFIPVGGWLDDVTLTGLVLYYLVRGRLPEFLSWWRNVGGADRHQQERAERTRSYQKERVDVSSESEGSKDPYEILGIKPGAKRDEIQAAYRRAAQAYHPDKVSHLGPELQKLAHKKFTQIQEAYEKLMSRGG